MTVYDVIEHCRAFRLVCGSIDALKLVKYLAFKFGCVGA
jgi:hypothetical protein